MDIKLVLLAPSLLFVLRVLCNMTTTIMNTILSPTPILTILSPKLTDVSSPIPWQNSKIDWATFPGASTNTSPTSSILGVKLELVSLARYKKR